MNPAAPSAVSTIDRRIWPMVMAIGLFAVLVMKETALSPLIVGAFAGLGLLGLFMTGLQHPVIPFYALVAYLPFSRVLVGGFGTHAAALNMTNLLIGWVLVGYLVNRASKREFFKTATLLNKVVWFFCFLGALNLIHAGFDYGSRYVELSITPMKQWFTPLFLYFMTLWIVRDKRALKTVVVLMMVVVVAVALMAIRDYMNEADSSLDKARIGGIAEHSNTLGAFFVYYMFLFLGFFLVYSRRPKAWLLLIPFTLCFRGIMVTFSRGAYLGFAVGSLAAAFFRSKVLFLAALAVGVLMVVNPVFLPSGIRYRMGQTMEGDVPPGMVQEDITQSLDGSAQTRIKIWEGALQMIKDHPWWGVGYGAFPAFIPHYTEGEIGLMDAHNSYLLIAAEMGIPTLLVFLLLLFMALYYTYWLYRHTEDPMIQAVALGFLAGLFGLIVTNMFGSRMDDQAVSSYFWILCGLIMRAVLMERQVIREKRKAAAA